MNDTFPTIIDLLTDTDGTRYVHFLGYGYYVGEPECTAR